MSAADENDCRFVTRSSASTTASIPISTTSGQQTTVSASSVEHSATTITAAATHGSADRAPQPTSLHSSLPFSTVVTCSQFIARSTPRRRSPTVAASSGVKRSLPSSQTSASTLTSSHQPIGPFCHPYLLEPGIGDNSSRLTPRIASDQVSRAGGSRATSQPPNPPLPPGLSQIFQVEHTGTATAAPFSFIPPGQTTFYQRPSSSRLAQMPYFSRTAADALLRMSLLRPVASYQQSFPSYLDALSMSVAGLEATTFSLQQRTASTSGPAGLQQHPPHPMYAAMFAKKKPRIDSPSPQPYQYQHAGQQLLSSPSSSQRRAAASSAQARMPSSSWSSSRGVRSASHYILPVRASTSSSPSMLQPRSRSSAEAGEAGYRHDMTSRYDVSPRRNMSLRHGEDPYPPWRPLSPSSSSLRHGDYSRRPSSSPTVGGVASRYTPVQLPHLPMVDSPTLTDIRHEQPHHPAHFTRGSWVQLGSGELKRVEDLVTADFVESAGISESLRIDTSMVVFMRENHERNTVILGFSVGQRGIQVTVEATLAHPFFVFKEGWSSYSPARTLYRYGLDCKQLKIGHRCISITQRELRQQTSEEIESSFDSPGASDSRDAHRGGTQRNADRDTPRGSDRGSQRDIQRDSDRGTQRDTQKDSDRGTQRDTENVYLLLLK